MSSGRPLYYQAPFNMSASFQKGSDWQGKVWGVLCECVYLDVVVVASWLIALCSIALWLLIICKGREHCGFLTVWRIVCSFLDGLCTIKHHLHLVLVEKVSNLSILFDGKRGWCQHYETTAVKRLRSPNTSKWWCEAIMIATVPGMSWKCYLLECYHMTIQYINIRTV